MQGPERYPKQHVIRTDATEQHLLSVIRVNQVANKVNPQNAALLYTHTNTKTSICVYECIYMNVCV